MGRTQECESLSAQHSGKSLNAVLAIALNISQILGECNDDCKDCHKHCNESAHNTRGGGPFSTSNQIISIRIDTLNPCSPRRVAPRMLPQLIQKLGTVEN